MRYTKYRLLCEADHRWHRGRRRWRELWVRELSTWHTHAARSTNTVSDTCSVWLSHDQPANVGLYVGSAPSPHRAPDAGYINLINLFCTCLFTITLLGVFSSVKCMLGNLRPQLQIIQSAMSRQKLLKFYGEAAVQCASVSTQQTLTGYSSWTLVEFSACWLATFTARGYKIQYKIQIKFI